MLSTSWASAQAGDILKQMQGRQVVTIAGRPLPIDDAGSPTSSAVGSVGDIGGHARAGGANRSQRRRERVRPPRSDAPCGGGCSGVSKAGISRLSPGHGKNYQLQCGLPIGTAQLPLLVGERLLYRDFEGLRAVDVRTAKTLWFYPCESAICREISPRQTIPSDGNPDPNNVMRCVVGNGTLGTLASDARHVFAIDRIEVDEPAPAGAASPTADAAAPLRQTNVLAAFELAAPTADVKPKWTAGGRSGDPDETRVLAGHFFLGPPLPVENRLFAVSEANELLHLSCLKSETGSVLWSQVLCSVPQPIGADHQRSALVCSPAFGEGIVVCPTQAGVLVAVEALTGRLLWAASYDDIEPQQRQQISAWPYGARKRIGHPGYVNLPVIHRDRIVYLPAHSEHIHCFDLATGRTRWRVRRDDLEPSTATEYVAGVTDEAVLVVGRRKCRALFLDSGAEQWTVRLGSSPVGQGLRLGEITTSHLTTDAWSASTSIRADRLWSRNRPAERGLGISSRAGI